MKRMTMSAVLLLAAACGNQATGNAMSNAAVPDGPMPAGAPPLPKPVPAKCAKPKLNVGAAKLDAAATAKFTTAFDIAFDRACAEGLFGDGRLVDPHAKDPNTLFVIDAPEANVVSVYFNAEAKPPMMVLEAPFGQPAQVPSADDIHEALYCKFHGATEEEMNQTGRCLPD